MLGAMLLSSGDFIFGNFAVREIEPWPLTFWRTAIGTVCLVPVVPQARRDLVAYFRRHKVKVMMLSVTGVVLPPWLTYRSLRSDELIDLSVGYTSDHGGPVLGLTPGGSGSRAFSVSD